MKKWLKYILIFGLIGAIVGMLFGPSIITNFFLKCPVDEITRQIAPCVGDPIRYMIRALPYGLVIGAIIGLIVAKIKTF